MQERGSNADQTNCGRDHVGGLSPAGLRRPTAPRRGFSFWVNAADIRQDVRYGSRQHRRVDNLNDDEILAEAIADVAFDVLRRIGNDPDARYGFFKRFLALAQEVVGDRGEQLDRAVDH